MMWTSVLLGAAVTVGSPDSAAPAAVIVTTSRGERAIPVLMTRGHPALPLDELSALLPVSARIAADDWAMVEFGGLVFRFLLDAPLFEFRNRIIHLVGGAYVQHDSLYVPLQWLAEYVPRSFSEAYRYDPVAARFEQIGITPVATRLSQPPSVGSLGVALSDAPAPARRLGLKWKHKVVIDAGHGGVDGGTTAGGLVEKNITLAIALVLGSELEKRGIEIVMTRTTDLLVPWRRRAPLCKANCDLFVSVHVNALDPGPSYRNIGGLETYFFDHRKQNAPDRIAQRENASLRYQPEGDRISDDALTAILRDLEENEYMRESARLAADVQEPAARVHPNGSRRVAQANLLVLRWATRPAILIETGYGTNRRDARFLSSRNGQRSLASGIADGIVQYLLHYESMINP